MIKINNTTILFNYKWLTKDGPECLNRVLELKQTLSLVYNTDLFLKQALNDQTVWTFKTAFSQRLDNICPVADVSNIYMDLGSNGVKINKFSVLFLFV
jgi:hypothetical protein